MELISRWPLVLYSRARPLAINASGGVQLVDGTPVPNAPGTAMVSGGVDVSGNQGGTVAVLGDRVGLVGAQIDASSTQGDGGQIRVGGEFQGNGPLPNAQRTYVDANTTLNADAGPTGNGGRIIVWADGATGFYGDITARGGQLSGNGGFAEVSGREDLRFDGTADLSSFNGRPGALLLDPTDIVISNDPSIATITQTAVEAMSGNFDISFVASGDIIIRSLIQRTDQNGIFRETLALQSGDRNISFVADGNINISANALLTAPSVAVSGSFSSTRTLSFTGNNITLGDISTRSGIPVNPDGSTGAPGGNVVINATGNVSTGYIATFADSNIRDGVIITNNPYNAGNITITGNSIDTSRGQLAAGASEGSGGNVELRARGNITTALIGTSSVAGGNGTRAGNITIISESGAIDTSRSAPNIPDPSIQGQGLSAGFISESGGSITIEARQGQFITPSISTGARINGGDLNIISPEIIVLGNLSSSPGLDGKTSGNITLRGNLIIGDSISFTTNTPNDIDSGNISIIGSINGINFGANTLTLDAGQSTIQIDGSIGLTNAIDALTISARRATIAGDIRVANRVDFVTTEMLLNSLAGNTSLSRSVIANDLDFSGTLQGSKLMCI